MASWMRITLSISEAAAGRQSAIQDAFAKLWLAAGAPPDAAMYGGKLPRDNDCFFTPAAVTLARPLLLSLGAVNCAPPDVRTLNVLVRNEGSPGSDW
jgi:hypothetical protein